MGESCIYDRFEQCSRDCVGCPRNLIDEDDYADYFVDREIERRNGIE